MIITIKREALHSKEVKKALKKDVAKYIINILDNAKIGDDFEIRIGVKIR